MFCALVIIRAGINEIGLNPGLLAHVKKKK